MKHALRVVLAGVAAGYILVGFGCGSDGGGNGVVDDTEVQKKVDEANAQLENILFDLVNGDDPEVPDDIDFTPAYNLYMEALAMDGNHVGANFGAGILEVVMLTQDQQVQDFFDKVDAFLDEDTYFEAPSESGAFHGSIGVSGPIFSFDQLEIPLAAPARMTRAFLRSGLQSDPTVDELQGICLNEILPRVTTCIARLTKVTANPAFVFTVTPKMQGDMNEDPIELDMTEVYATMAGLSALRAGLLHFTAYDFNLDAYTGAEMQAALTRGSDFGSLHPEGTSRMHSALEAWRDAVNNLDLAVNFLESEVDDQDDDLIFLDPYDDFTQADLDSIKHYIPKARNILDGSDWLKFDWDDNSDTPDEKIFFSLDSFYSSPVEDLKELLPPYSVTLDTSPVSTEWVNEDSLVYATVNIPAQGWYYWERNASYDDGELEYYWENSNMDVPEWEAVWNSFAARAENVPYASLYAWFSRDLSPGPHTISIYISFGYEVALRSRYVPVITWDADSFDEWRFPDPEFGGLLPEMTDPELKRIFDITGDDWEKSVVIDIWDLDVDSPTTPPQPGLIHP